jgi:hypothetical protein
MSPPQTSRMVQKIRRLAASLGIGSRLPMDDTAAGVRPMMRSTDAPNIPAAQLRLMGYKQIASDHSNCRYPNTCLGLCKGKAGLAVIRAAPEGDMP